MKKNISFLVKKVWAHIVTALESLALIPGIGILLSVLTSVAVYTVLSLLWP